MGWVDVKHYSQMRDIHYVYGWPLNFTKLQKWLTFRIDDQVLAPCLLDAVGHAVLGVQIDAANDTT